MVRLVDIANAPMQKAIFEAGDTIFLRFIILKISI